MFRNFTPHTIHVVLSSGEQRAFPSEGVARCTVTSVEVGEIEGIKIFQNQFGEVEGLPEQNWKDVFIVSLLVLQAVVGKRVDCVGPDTSPNGNPLRNEAGQIVAVRRFQSI